MICDNIEKIRKAKGVTKTHLAKKLGLSLQGYRYVTSNATRLDVERLRTISNELNISVEIFFNDKLTESVIRSLAQGTLPKTG